VPRVRALERDTGPGCDKSDEVGIAKWERLGLDLERIVTSVQYNLECRTNSVRTSAKSYRDKELGGQGFLRS